MASSEQTAQCAAELIGKGFRKVLVTLGARGSLLADGSGRVPVPPFQVSAVDSTGAGDAFIGSFATFLAEGVPERDAALRANLYAALSTTRVGAQQSFPTRDVFEEEWLRRSKDVV